MTRTLKGYDAIEYAERYDVPLCKYNDPTEDAREGLTVDEARKVAAEDPTLIYVVADPSKLRLIATWTAGQNTETDDPVRIAWADGTPATMDDFRRIGTNTQSDPDFAQDGSVSFGYAVE